MSEPMGCSNQMNSGFLQDSTIPLLETVSEEARRQTGMNISVEKFYRCLLTKPLYRIGKQRSFRLLLPGFV